MYGPPNGGGVGDTQFTPQPGGTVMLTRGANTPPGRTRSVYGRPPGTPAMLVHAGVVTAANAAVTSVCRAIAGSMSAASTKPVVGFRSALPAIDAASAGNPETSACAIDP